MQKGSSVDVRKVARERRKIRTNPKIFLGNIASLIHDFFHIIKYGFFSQEKELVRVSGFNIFYQEDVHEN
jgi:hypothetical protein